MQVQVVEPAPLALEQLGLLQQPLSVEEIVLQLRDSKFQSKLRVLDTDDVKQTTSLFSFQGKSARYCFMVFNLWITRSVRNKLLWALRWANVSLGCRHLSAIIRLPTKAPDIKTCTFHWSRRTIALMWTLNVSN